MKSALDVEVSCFKSYSGKEPKSVNLLTWLTSNKYATQIKELRSFSDKSRRDEIKASLPAITPSGVFHPVRKEKNLIKHSGLICIDIDTKGNEGITNFEVLKEQLFRIQNVAYAGLSASGNGFFLLIPIASPKRHKDHFKAIQQDFADYGIQIDSAPQNVASLRGYSFDEEALLRPNAKPYKKLAKAETKQSPSKIKRSFNPSNYRSSTRAQVEYLITEIINRRIDITQYEPDWFRLACALANEFGESGRDYFHTISQYHSSYDPNEADQKYNHALTGRYSLIGIGTFFKLAESVCC